jgi:hypothetical protein
MDATQIVNDHIKILKDALLRTVASTQSTGDRIRSIQRYLEEYKMWVDVKNILSKK